MRWFLDMNLMERSFDPTVFTKNRRRLLEHRAAQALVDEVVWEAARRGLLSDENFSVDETLIEAPASNAVGRPGGSGHGGPGRSGENGVPARRGRNAVEVDFPPDLPRIMADRQRIVQALGNLLSNAFRRSPDSSAIRVSAALDDVYVAISVADEGGGVSAERLPQLFKKFSRTEGGDGGTTVGGESLGLAVCKGIVEVHGGRIWAESDGPGLGARFTFTVPVVAEAANDWATGPVRLSAVSGQGARDRARSGGRRRPSDTWYVRNMLSEAGYTSVVTGDPEELELLIEVEKPDLILLDMELSGTDEVELMRRIPQTTDAPVVFLSGEAKTWTLRGPLRWEPTTTS